MYNYNHLYYFYVTAKSGSVTNAAKHLNISQPSLTSQIRVLEGQLGIKLFQKVGRVNHLNENGSLIFGFCRQMFELSEEMSEIILNGMPTSTRRIHIGVSDEVERSFVVEVVSHFLKKQLPEKRPKVTIVSGTHGQLEEKLKFREIDIVVTETSMSDPNLMNLARVESPVVLTCSKKSKIALGLLKAKNVKQPSVDLIRNLAPQWLMPSSRFKLRSEIDLFFESNEVKGRIVLESDVLASLVRSVADEIGFAFLPLLYVKRELKENSIRIIGSSKGYWEYKLWLACNPHSSDDFLIESFSESFSAVGKAAKKQRIDQ